MANEDYKNGKLVEIIREFDNTGNRYEINGMKQSLIIPFWRTQNGKFNVIPLGSYKFINESGNDYIEILDEEILTTATEFQIVYTYSQTSSKYIDDFPDIGVLVEKYNSLVDDVTGMFSYLKSVGMIADTMQMTKVLSQLEPLTTWYMNESGEIEALPVSELYNKFQQMIDTLYKEVKSLLDVDYSNMSTELRNKTDSFLSELSTLKTSLSSQMIQEVSDEGAKQISEIEKEGEKQLEAIIGAGGGLEPRVENLENNKQDKTDSSLQTTSKTIPGAINELNSGKLGKKETAATAEKLKTARTINGVAFDGSANITVADSTKVPLSGNSTITGNLTTTGNLNANEITSTGNVTAYSDRKTKTNIKELSECLKKLNTLQGYSYLMLASNEESMGFMADEVEKVFPMAVITDENGIKKVAYLSLIAPIVCAIQELTERVEALERGQ